MKNRLHLNACFGLILMGIGGVIAFIAGVSIYWNSYYHELDGLGVWMRWDWEDLYFLMLGTFYILVGGGLMARAKWAHWATSVVGVFAFLGWSHVVYEYFEFRRINRADFWLELGITGLIYGLIICSWLFVGNEKIKKELTESNEAFWDHEILDA